MISKGPIAILCCASVAAFLIAFDEQRPQRQPAAEEGASAKWEDDFEKMRGTIEAHSLSIDQMAAASSAQAVEIEKVQEQAAFQSELLAVLSSHEPKWTDWGTFVVAVVTGMISLITVWISILVFKLNKAVMRLNERLVWFTGAMESHSAKTLELKIAEHNKQAAAHERIDMLWWDPTEKEWPIDPKHGEKVKTKKVYFGIPPEKRKKPS